MAGLLIPVKVAGKVAGKVLEMDSVMVDALDHYAGLGVTCFQSPSSLFCGAYQVAWLRGSL